MDTGLHWRTESLEPGDHCMYLHNTIYPERLALPCIRSRLVNLPEKSSQTTTHMVNAIATLERWWHSKFGEERTIEMMNPVDLNKYLEQFFPILRRPSGVEYTKDSLTNFRSYLDRFLRETGFGPQGARAWPTGSSHYADSFGLDVTTMQELEGRFSVVDTCLYPSVFPERLKAANIKKRIPDLEKKSANSTMNLINAVSTLERWWWKKYGEERDVETMPAADLDRYLDEFLPILRRPNGSDYRPDTLSNFRSFLDRFLKENGSQLSISKSADFYQSQMTFKAKRHWLYVVNAQM